MHEILRRERHSLFLPERYQSLIFFGLRVATPASSFMASTTLTWGLEFVLPHAGCRKGVLRDLCELVRQDLLAEFGSHVGMPSAFKC